MNRFGNMLMTLGHRYGGNRSDSIPISIMGSLAGLAVCMFGGIGFVAIHEGKAVDSVPTPEWLIVAFMVAIGPLLLVVGAIVGLAIAQWAINFVVKDHISFNILYFILGIDTEEELKHARKTELNIAEGSTLAMGFHVFSFLVLLGLGLFWAYPTLGMIGVLLFAILFGARQAFDAIFTVKKKLDDVEKGDQS